ARSGRVVHRGIFAEVIYDALALASFSVPTRSIASSKLAKLLPANASVQASRMRSALSFPITGATKRINFSRTFARSNGRAGSPGVSRTTRSWGAEPAVTATRAGQLRG